MQDKKSLVRELARTRGEKQLLLHSSTDTGAVGRSELEHDDTRKFEFDQQLLNVAGQGQSQSEQRQRKAGQNEPTSDKQEAHDQDQHEQNHAPQNQLNNTEHAPNQEDQTVQGTTTTRLTTKLPL